MPNSNLRQLIEEHRSVEPYVGYYLTECICGKYVGPDYEGHLADVIENWHLVRSDAEQ